MQSPCSGAGCMDAGSYNTMTPELRAGQMRQCDSDVQREVVTCTMGGGKSNGSNNGLESSLEFPNADAIEIFTNG